MTLKLSTKALPAQAFRKAAAEAEHSWSPRASPRPPGGAKTKRALRVFSKRLIADERA